MKKVKVAIPESVYDQWSEICEIGGQKIMMRNYIPYSEMVEFATEYAQHTCVIDNDAQIAYGAIEHQKIEDYLVLKYFSNVDVDDMDDPFEYAANLKMLIEKDVGNFFYENDGNVSDTKWLANTFAEETRTIYNQYHSLGAKIIKSFGGLLNSGDLIKEIAESREISERMIDFVQSKDNALDNVTLFKQFAKKPE